MQGWDVCEGGGREGGERGLTGGAGMSMREGNAREVGRVGREGGEERERVGGGEVGWIRSSRGGRDFLFFFYFYFFFSFSPFSFEQKFIYVSWVPTKKYSM
jgi:hypothetical protein